MSHTIQIKKNSRFAPNTKPIGRDIINRNSKDKPLKGVAYPFFMPRFLNFSKNRTTKTRKYNKNPKIWRQTQ